MSHTHMRKHIHILKRANTLDMKLTHQDQKERQVHSYTCIEGKWIERQGA
jgi:hypothetical protein